MMQLVDITNQHIEKLKRRIIYFALTSWIILTVSILIISIIENKSTSLSNIILKSPSF